MGTLCVITDSQITSRKIIQRRHLVLGISLPQFVLCKTIYSRTGMGKQDQPHNIGTSRVQDETNFMERFFILFLIFLRWSIIERLERAYHHHKFFHTRTQHHPWSLNKLRNLYQTMHLAMSRCAGSTWYSFLQGRWVLNGCVFQLTTLRRIQKTCNEFKMVSESKIEAIAIFLRIFGARMKILLMIIKVKILMLIKWPYRSPPQIMLTSEPRKAIILGTRSPIFWKTNFLFGNSFLEPPHSTHRYIGALLRNSNQIIKGVSIFLPGHPDPWELWFSASMTWMEN